MKKTPLCFAIIIYFLATIASAGDFSGPLAIKNGHPLYAALGSPSLVSAEPDNSIDINFSYSSSYLVAGPGDWHFGIDMETALLDVNLKHSAGKELEVGIDLPIIRYGAGFMDDFIDTYHRVLGMAGAYGRHDRPRNEFLLDVTSHGKQVIHGEPGETKLGDVMLEIKKVIFSQGMNVVSVQGFLNLPTGDPDSGQGSGRTNGGGAVLINMGLRSELMLYANAGIGLIEKLKALQEVNLKNYYYGGAGLEWRYSERLSLDLQMFIQSSPFPTTEEDSIDFASMMSSVGGRYKIDAASSFGVAVTEDPFAAGAPDFMMSIDYRHGF